jgi:hypothetical protein
MRVNTLLSAAFLRTALLGAVVVGAPLAAGAHPLDHLRTKDDIGMNKVPNRGTSHILVVPSRVNVDQFPQERWIELRQFYNPEGGPNTFRGYWQAASNGLYDPIPHLAEPVIYDDYCPIPGRRLGDCELSIQDAALLGGGRVGEMLTGLLERVRDEQNLDLSRFDVNGVDGEPDGWFDGLIIDSEIINGVGLPLAALNATLRVEPTPGADGSDPDAPRILAGNVAMVPPDNHEYGHVLGFIDLYNGPTITDLMGFPNRGGISAFTRQQIEWGEVISAPGEGSWTLEPVLSGGAVLRIGEGPIYFMIEYRAGPGHSDWEQIPEGVFVYAIDEEQLPTSRLGFLDVQAGDLYYPNQDPPYVAVNLPLRCDWETTGNVTSCALAEPGEKQVLRHPSARSMYDLRVVLEEIGDGQAKVRVEPNEDEPDAEPEPEPEPEDAGVELDAGPSVEQTSDGGGSDGCEAASGAPLGWLLALCALAFPLRRRRR